MNYIITYFIIGFILTIIYDMIGIYLVKRDELKFTNAERILLLLFWPLVISISIIKSLKD